MNFSSEEKELIARALNRLTREYIRSIKRARKDHLREYDERKLVVIANIETKLKT